MLSKLAGVVRPWCGPAATGVFDTGRDHVPRIAHATLEPSKLKNTKILCFSYIFQRYVKYFYCDIIVKNCSLSIPKTTVYDFWFLALL